MIVWLASYPRSGNTFFRVLLKQWCGMTTYSVYDDPDLVEMGAGDTVGHAVLPDSIEELRESSETFFVKTHELPSDDSHALYLVRDGRDAIVSHARYIVENWASDHLPKEGDFTAVLKEVIRADDGNWHKHFGGWGNHVMAWARRPNTQVARFEDLIDDPITTTKRVLNPFGISMESDTGVPTFEELHEKWPKFFRKGQTGSWRQEMPWTVHRLFWKHHAEAMRLLGYDR
jgi:Sulfotransferase domain